MKLNYLWCLLVVTCLGCDDTTNQVGLDVLPDGDNLSASQEFYNVPTNSILSGPVYASGDNAFLGNYSDPLFGKLEASFVTQFNCTDDFEPYVEDGQIIKSTIKAKILLGYSKTNFFGDEYNTCALSIYNLNKSLEEENDSYYSSDFDPKDFYDTSSTPIGTAIYSARNNTVDDALWESTTYSPAIVVDIPAAVGSEIIALTTTHPEYFKNSNTFINNVFKGVYVKMTHGDGTILYINNVVLNVYADVYVKDEDGNYPIKREAVGYETEDSITSESVIAQFAATKEVIQANQFINSGQLANFVADKKCTYLKTPAGIFTEATLPLEDVFENHPNDSINAASITFNAYNKSGVTSIEELPYPTTIVMLRKDELSTFFKNNELTDNITSYITSIGDENEYTFSNISKLIKTCLKEKKAGTASADWNKVVLVPVVIGYDSAGSTLVSINHNLKLTSAKLLGGEEGEDIKMTVTYTTFK